MKTKKPVIFLAVVFLVCSAAFLAIEPRCYGKTAYRWPQSDGTDVLVPEIVIETIRLPNRSRFDDNRPVYVADESNGFLERPKNFSAKMLEMFRMIHGNGYWRAREMRYYPFIPCQLTDGGKPVYADLSIVYPLTINGEQSRFAKFIDQVNGRLVLFMEKKEVRVDKAKN